MKPTVYVETSVVSYLTARPSRAFRVAARQRATRGWWNGAAERFELVASELVLAEASAGDPAAARARLAALETVRLLDPFPEAERLAEELLASGAIPRGAETDAAHIAIAAVGGIDYLATWNFKHIANAAALSRIEHAPRHRGGERPQAPGPGGADPHRRPPRRRRRLQSPPACRIVPWREARRRPGRIRR